MENITQSVHYISKSFLWISVGGCNLFGHNDLHGGRVNAGTTLVFFVIALMNFFQSIGESCLEKRGVCG